MKNLLLFLAFAMGVFACNPPQKSEGNAADKTFAKFEDTFLDAYWQHYPAASIYNGYGKYYDSLIVPNAAAFANDIAFSKQWLDALNQLPINQLSDNNKISYNVIKNQLESDSWYVSTFKPQEWNPSMYNVAGECDYLINQPYAPLNERLKTLSNHLQNTDAYYKAAISNLNKPTKEHLELAIIQNQGGLSVFGTALMDSIKVSNLSAAEKSILEQNIAKTRQAINTYISDLKTIASNKKTEYRSWRIGKELFTQKFKYDIAADLTPEQVYEKALEDKKMLHKKMFDVASSAWAKYFKTQPKPKDSLQVIAMILEQIQLQHAKPEEFFNSLTNQVHELKKFIIEKDLFDFDTANPPIKVRLMPEYARGVSTASADFIPPYQKQGTTYYNIDDLTKYPPEKAEKALRADNTFGSQMLSIHEAVPGHCLQGIYNNKKSPDVLRSVFQNGAMIEGWAVYTEGMMVENGWGNHAPEIELELYKWNLRELANTLLDYDNHCLNAPKEAIVNLLVKECFQNSAQVEEKYHRATVSQVQLCSYFTGATAIKSLREEYKKKMGDKYTLKDFHEKFLSFGSSPVKYIRERMLQ
jgi:uncharacterized protein (DUF885 family)